MKLLPATIATALLTTTSSVHANDAATIEALTAKIDRLERALENVIAEQEKQPTISLKPGLRIQTADKTYSFGVDGFVQADAGWVADDHSDLADSTHIKRARLGIKGVIAKDWAYRVLTDFGDDDFKLMDAHISYKGLKNVTLKAGQFKEFYSLEQLMAAKYWTFAEKASMAALTPKRSFGLGLTHGYKHGLISAGIFGENINKKRTDDEGYGFTGRVTYTSKLHNSTHLHIGLSGTYRSVDNETNTVTFKHAGENTLTSAFLTTGKIANAESITSLTPELALTYGSFGLQAEYTDTTVSRDTLESLNFKGYYAEASYYLTGESRNYNKKKGIFGKVKPLADFSLNDGGFGAWQIAYRYSHLDLTDRDVKGGSMSNHTLGLNWLPNTFTRFSANVIQVDTDENAKVANNDSTIFMLRTQFEF